MRGGQEKPDLVEGSLEQKTKGAEEVSQVRCQWKEHSRQREQLVQKPWESSRPDLFSSKEVKVWRKRVVGMWSGGKGLYGSWDALDKFSFYSE